MWLKHYLSIIEWNDESVSHWADLFGVKGHQVETVSGDVEVDAHASKLQVALS